MRKPAFLNRLQHEPLESRNLLHGGGAGEPLPDFALQDVNPTSPLHQQSVSMGDVSGTRAIYFIHST